MGATEKCLPDSILSSSGIKIDKIRMFDQEVGQREHTAKKGYQFIGSTDGKVR